MSLGMNVPGRRLDELEKHCFNICLAASESVRLHANWMTVAVDFSYVCAVALIFLQNTSIGTNGVSSSHDS